MAIPKLYTIERQVLYKKGLRLTKNGRCTCCGSYVVRKNMSGRRTVEVFARTGLCKRCQRLDE